MKKLISVILFMTLSFAMFSKNDVSKNRVATVSTSEVKNKNKAYDTDTLPVARTMYLPSKQVSAYIRIWKLKNGQYWKASDVKGNLLTELNIFFATINLQGKVSIQTGMDLKNEIRNLKILYPMLRITLSISGTGEKGFSYVTSNQMTRNIFIKSLVDVITEYGFTGVDISFEDTEKISDGMIILLADLRKSLYALEEKTGQYYTISALLPSNKSFIENTDVHAVNLICDSLKIMNYDFQDNENKITSHASNLYSIGKSWSSDICINEYIKKGVKREKILFGIPFYAQSWSGIKANEYRGLNQKFKKYDGALSVSDVEKKQNQGFSEYWDKKQFASWLYDGDTFISFTSLKQLKEIITYVRKAKLGGIMYFEYSFDFNAKLLKELRQFF